MYDRAFHAREKRFIYLEDDFTRVTEFVNLIQFFFNRIGRVFLGFCNFKNYKNFFERSIMAVEGLEPTINLAQLRYF